MQLCPCPCGIQTLDPSPVLHGTVVGCNVKLRVVYPGTGCFPSLGFPFDSWGSAAPGPSAWSNMLQTFLCSSLLISVCVLVDVRRAGLSIPEDLPDSLSLWPRKDLVWFIHSPNAEACFRRTTQALKGIS